MIFITNECFNFVGNKYPSGYGRVRISGTSKRALAHRVSFHFFSGIDPKGKVVRHKCDNPSCINPVHLEIGDQKDNMRDRIERGRNPYKNKTHCPKGHEYSGENLYVTSKGHRQCLICKKEAWRRFSAKSN